MSYIDPEEELYRAVDAEAALALRYDAGEVRDDTMDEASQRVLRAARELCGSPSTRPIRAVIERRQSAIDRYKG